MMPGGTGIEHLKPRLNVLAFSNRKDFGDAQVEIFVKRPAQFALSLVVVSPLWRERKNIGLEPFGVALSKPAVGIAALVGAISAGKRDLHFVKATDRTPIYGERPAGGNGIKPQSMTERSAQIRVLAVDDHALVRQGIAVLLDTEAGMKLVAEASNGREAIQQFRAHRPGITLMDLQMPEMNGLDAIIAIRGEFPDAKIIVLTTYKGDVQILRALKAGAQGYLLKNTFHKELIETIRAVHAGKKALSPEASYEIAEHATDDALTPAEISVLRLIAAGNANKQIADQLSITEETVKGRVKNMLSKLGANDPTQAAMIGLKRGIIEL